MLLTNVVVIVIDLISNVKSTIGKVTKEEFVKAWIICFSEFGAIAICEDAKLKNEPLESGNRADCYKIEYFAPILHTGAWHHDSSRAERRTLARTRYFN